jgi:hypothetical protein
LAEIQQSVCFKTAGFGPDNRACGKRKEVSGDWRQLGRNDTDIVPVNTGPVAGGLAADFELSTRVQSPTLEEDEFGQFLSTKGCESGIVTNVAISEYPCQLDLVVSFTLYLSLVFRAPLRLTAQ